MLMHLSLTDISNIYFLIADKIRYFRDISKDTYCVILIQMFDLGVGHNDYLHNTMIIQHPH